MAVGRHEMEILTTPESCESCGTTVAVTRQVASGNTRLSHIGSDGQVLPGPHTPLECRSRR
jgi:hypothetical protein